MSNQFLSRKLKTITERVSVMQGPDKPSGLITDPKEFVPVQNGLVSINYVSDLDFATLIDTIPEGELELVDEHESLSVTGLSEGKITENRSQEFGRYVSITPSDIDSYAGKMIVGNTLVSYAETVEQAKILLLQKAFATLQQQMATTVGKYIYGALFGQIDSKRKTGSTKSLTLPYLDWLTVSTPWTDVNAPIIADMENIINLMLNWTVPKQMGNSKTLMSSKITRLIAKNKQVAGLYSPQFAQNISYLPQNVLNNGTLAEYFGQIVSGDDVYYVNGVPTRYAPENKILVASDTQSTPIIDVYVGPTKLDPKYVTRDERTGASTHIYDGTIDNNTSSEKIGTLTAGLRARIAVRKRLNRLNGVLEVF